MNKYKKMNIKKNIFKKLSCIETVLKENLKNA